MKNLNQQLDKILHKYDILEKDIHQCSINGQTGEEFIQASKEYARIGKLVTFIKEYRQILSDIHDAQLMMNDKNNDADIIKFAESEYYQLKQDIIAKEQELKIMLLTKDDADSKSAILEIRAGTGGEEAALFADELLRMYQRYAECEAWTFEILSMNNTDIGGINNVTVSIKGSDVFGRLKFESGGHRVQRVPVTESGGRIHTSAATVAVLPEVDEVDIDIRDQDLRIDTYRAQGAGGQHVNTTDSAVRITHLPTNIVVTCQDETSQHKNKARAMRILRARIYESERQKIAEERSSTRKLMIGSGDRSERIRTYNYPQGRVTDHRINLTLYKLPQILQGDGLQEVIDELMKADQLEQLAMLENDD